ncbi:MAG: hypothetical protein ACAI44_03220 [Candidatus Sericytochromatia bacterium]
MSIKVCQKCKTTNAVGNRACIKCGEPLKDVGQSEQKFGHLYFAMGKNLFSKLLTWAVIISVIFALVAVLKLPLFEMFH